MRGARSSAWLPLLALLLGGGLFPAGCSRMESYRETRPLMSTYVSVTLLARDRRTASAAMEAAFAEVSRLEGVFSIWEPGTELSRVNARAAREPVALSADVLELSTRALEMAARTDGAFDPTIGPLVRLWRVTRRRRPPPEAEIEAARRLVGFRNVRLEEGRIRFLRDGVLFDPGGIAKGFTADRVVALLEERGIAGGVVAVAGDVRVFGGRRRGRPWRVGIRAPRGEGLLGWVELEDGAVSTSGDYERYFEYGGVRYHHLIDPRTGRPARGFRSVTVIAEDAVTADALATGLFVMGPGKARRKAGRERIRAVFVDEQGRVWASEAAQPILTLRPPDGREETGDRSQKPERRERPP